MVFAGEGYTAPCVLGEARRPMHPGDRLGGNARQWEGGKIKARRDDCGYLWSVLPFHPEATGSLRRQGSGDAPSSAPGRDSNLLMEHAVIRWQSLEGKPHCKPSLSP